MSESAVVSDVLEASAASRGAVSAASVTWALASAAVIILKMAGCNVTYDEALPAVVLISWLGAELGARKQPRKAVAICSKCGHKLLQGGIFRRFWPWKYCTSCGSRMYYACDSGHLLSIFTDETTGNHIFCAKCGAQVPTHPLSLAEVDKLLTDLLVRAQASTLLKPFSAAVGCSLMSKVAAYMRTNVEATEEYWHLLNWLVAVPSTFDSTHAGTLMLNIMNKMPAPIPAEKWLALDEQLQKAKPHPLELRPKSNVIP